MASLTAAAAAAPSSHPIIPVGDSPLTSPTVTAQIEKTDADLEVVAHRVLSEMQMKGITCSANIISPFTTLDLRLGQENRYYHEFGHKFLDFMRYRVKLERARFAVNSVLSHLILKDFNDSFSSALTAIARLGVGEDRETSTYAAAQIAFHGVSALRITIVEDVAQATLIARGERSGSIAEHTFVLLGIEYHEFRKYNKVYKGKISHILTHLKHGLFFDYSSNLICSLKEFKFKGKGFLTYMKSRRIQHVWRVCTKSVSGWQKVAEEGNRIYELALELLSNRTEKGLSTFSMMEEYTENLVNVDAIKELSKIFPKSHMPWSSSAEKPGKGVWVQGSLEDVQEASIRLHELGIETKVMKKTSLNPSQQIIYFCYVKRPNLIKLRAINSSLSTPAVPAVLIVPAAALHVSAPALPVAFTRISRIPVLAEKERKEAVTQ